MPNILSQMNNWGAFIFFAGWCFIALLYVFFMVPEVAGLSMEEMDALFKGPWFNAWRTAKKPAEVIQSDRSLSLSQVSRVTTPCSSGLVANREPKQG